MWQVTGGCSLWVLNSDLLFYEILIIFSWSCIIIVNWIWIFWGADSRLGDVCWYYNSDSSGAVSNLGFEKSVDGADIIIDEYRSELSGDGDILD